MLSGVSESVRSARVAISAKVAANMLQAVRVDRVLTMDLHADQIQGFFDIPVDNIYAAPVLLGDVWKQRYENLIVVSPDVGGVVRARALLKHFRSPQAVFSAGAEELQNVEGIGEKLAAGIREALEKPYRTKQKL